MPSPFPATGIEARAKVNLSLHVTGRRTDGYHRLDGLVVFTELGDRLAFEEADEDRLTLAGPMAPALDGGDNLALRAVRAARDAGQRRGVAIPPFHITLDKRLPVAAGLGGGSADAAAVLRTLAGAYNLPAVELSDVALALGADVPMCLASRPARIAGIGEIVTPLPAMPELFLLLVNPGVAVSTPAVFARPREEPSAPPDIPAGGFATLDRLLHYLQSARNDLEAAACEIAPAIGSVVDALQNTGPRLVRMSGSGATVFALYDDRTGAEAAAAAISAAEPAWWVAATACPPVLSA